MVSYSSGTVMFPVSFGNACQDIIVDKSLSCYLLSYDPPSNQVDLSSKR